MLLENLHYFPNLSNNFGFTTIWHSQSGATQIFHRRLAKSDITVIPSVTCMEWLCQWQSHGSLVSSSTTSGFLTNMSEERNATSPSATQGTNRQKTEQKRN